LKIEHRKINPSKIEEVLLKPEYIFYDLHTQSMVAIKEIELYGNKIHLVVVFTIEEKGVKIVTVYPCRKIDGEIASKEGKRWLRLK
ncbi:DUF4258 domain-containing protein, partial [Thermosulfurimonas sp.]|uniref:DUF4258 domain-containing protein n=1 Tax=Thermosulfurimonas sp. TaxID=2080236 RepID=UPI0025D0DE48